MSANPPWADKKLTEKQRGHMAFRYLDWLLTKNVPSGGFRLLYAITQCFNEKNQFHCFPSIDYLAALHPSESPSTVWSMLPKLEKIGAIEIEWGSKGSGHPNAIPPARGILGVLFRAGKRANAQTCSGAKKNLDRSVFQNPDRSVFPTSLKTPMDRHRKPRSVDEKTPTHRCEPLLSH